MIRFLICGRAVGKRKRGSQKSVRVQYGGLVLFGFVSYFAGFFVVCFVCVFFFGWFFTSDVKDLLKVAVKQLGCF